MRRIRITLAYDGTGYHGWQVQPGLPTIQGALEEIVSGVEGNPVHVAGSGRTDAGVHALAQVAAFTIANPIPVDNLQRALNRLLPPAIRIFELAETHTDFHPRFDAIAKTYQYTLFRGPICSPFQWRYVHHHPFPLNEDAMREAARVFEGEHDFTAFAAADNSEASRGERPKSHVRRIFRSELVRSGDTLLYTVRGSGFLKHMVRNIVGTLVETGRGNIAAPAIASLLSGTVSGKSGPTAPAKGLTLQSVEYSPFT